MQERHDRGYGLPCMLPPFLIVGMLDPMPPPPLLAYLFACSKSTAPRRSKRALVAVQNLSFTISAWTGRSQSFHLIAMDGAKMDQIGKMGWATTPIQVEASFSMVAFVAFVFMQKQKQRVNVSLWSPHLRHLSVSHMLSCYTAGMAVFAFGRLGPGRVM